MHSYLSSATHNIAWSIGCFYNNYKKGKVFIMRKNHVPENLGQNDGREKQSTTLLFLGLIVFMKFYFN